MADRLLTVEKVLRVAHLLGKEGALSVREVSERLLMHKTVTHRLLNSLRHEGWAFQEPDTKKYRLGLRMWEIGMGALHLYPVYTVALPHIERLALEQKETTGLAVFDHGEMLFIAQVRVVDGTPITVPVAGRALPHTTSGGKVALAFMPDSDARVRIDTLPAVTPRTVTGDKLVKELNEVRERGYAVNRGGRELTSAGIAAPVFDRTGRYIASIYASGPTKRYTDERVKALAPAVTGCASQISLALGYRMNWSG